MNKRHIHVLLRLRYSESKTKGLTNPAISSTVYLLPWPTPVFVAQDLVVAVAGG